jgi:hypothetical protein
VQITPPPPPLRHPKTLPSVGKGVPFTVNDPRFEENAEVSMKRMLMMFKFLDDVNKEFRQVTKAWSGMVREQMHTQHTDTTIINSDTSTRVLLRKFRTSHQDMIRYGEKGHFNS